MPDLGLTGHTALVLWAQLALLLAFAHGFGGVARRLGQPAIIGALVAGLVLGPSVFGVVWPGGEQWLLPKHAEPLGAISQVCLLVLLVVLGAETDLGLLRRLGRPAAVVTAFSIVVPLAAGLGAGELSPDALLGDHGGRGTFALVLAGALSVSSLPVVARTISELGMVRRNFGQLSIAAATINDAYGFLVLAVVAALTGSSASSGPIALVIALGGLLVFTLLLAVAGQPLVDALLRRVRRQGPNVVGSLAVCLIAAFAAATITQGIGIDGALGAFLAGVLLGRSRFQQGQALRHLESFSAALCAPLYFATAGLRVDVTDLSQLMVLASFGALLAVAVVSKFGAVVAGARAARLPWREGSAMGVVLNGRGALQVIIGSAGLELGLLSGSAYTVIILLSIVTSVAIPPVLRRIVGEWSGTAEERRRLERESELETNVVVRGQRLLLPSRGSANAVAAASVLHCAWPQESEVTVFSIADRPAGEEPDLSAVLAALSGRPVRRRTAVGVGAGGVEGGEVVAEQVLAEANLGYGVIAIGAAESPNPDRLVPPVVGELLNRSPLPLLIVRRGAGELSEHGGPGPAAGSFQRVLVPVTGTASSRAGQEVANAIARRAGAQVHVLHVLTRPLAVSARQGRRADPEATPAATGSARAVLGEATSTAAAQDVAPETSLRQGPFAGAEVAEAVRELGADLVVAGATVRRVGGRPFLGHTIEHLLEHVVEPTVAVVVMPDRPASGPGAAGEDSADGHTDRSQR